MIFLRKSQIFSRFLQKIPPLRPASEVAKGILYDALPIGDSSQKA